MSEEVLDLTSGEEAVLLQAKKRARGETSQGHPLEASEVINLGDDEGEDDVTPPLLPKKSAAALAAAKPVPWQGMQGTRRILAEFQYITKLLQDGQRHFGPAALCELSMVEDNVSCWQLKVKV